MIGCGVLSWDSILLAKLALVDLSGETASVLCGESMIVVIRNASFSATWLGATILTIARSCRVFRWRMMQSTGMLATAVVKASIGSGAFQFPSVTSRIRAGVSGGIEGGDLYCVCQV